MFSYLRAVKELVLMLEHSGYHAIILDLDITLSLEINR